MQYTDRAANAAGDPCRNDPDPARQGLVEASTRVFISAGRIALKGFRQQDNGDNDGWADTNETVQLWLSFTNKSGFDVDDLAASLDAADDAPR